MKKQTTWKWTYIYIAKEEFIGTKKEFENFKKEREKQNDGLCGSIRKQHLKYIHS